MQNIANIRFAENSILINVYNFFVIVVVKAIALIQFIINRDEAFEMNVPNC